MKRNFLIFVLSILTLPALQRYAVADGIPLQDQCELITTLPERAAEMMVTVDGFVNGLSDFDLQSKTLTIGTVTREEYLEFLKGRAMEYTYEDVEKLKRVAASITKKLDDAGLHPAFPPIIEVIKTDMKEESGASAYTRLNYIAMSADMFGMSDKDFEDVFIHELFHVLSRNNQQLQGKIYNSLGFKKSNEVPYPDGIQRISNPDAPFNNYYITVESADGPVDAMLVLYSLKDYEGGSFFRYAKLGLMVVEGDDNNKTPVIKDGKPVILQLDEVSNFFEQVGRNTGYIIHPEEASADHFRMLVNKESAPDQWIIDKLKTIIQESGS